MNVKEKDFDPEMLLEKPLMAHLSSYCAEGPRDSPIWFLWQEERLWLFGNEDDSFTSRLAVDPRCAVGIVDFHLEQGVLLHLGIRGRAVIHTVNLEKRNAFVSKYLGDEDSWNPWFTKHIVNTISLMIEIIPETLVARDVSFFKETPNPYQNKT